MVIIILKGDIKNKGGVVDGIRLAQDHSQNIRKNVRGTERWIKWIKPVGINFIPEIIFVDFYWNLVYKLECMNKMFISPSVWMMPVDISVIWSQTGIWGWTKGFLCCSFIFTYFESLIYLYNVNETAERGAVTTE
jgi:hypothetical protein